MKITVKRFHPHFEPKSIEMSYEIPDGLTLLEALEYIKEKIDKTLTFSKGCRSGVCGSCAVRVNEKEVLACEYKIKDGDKIEPLKYIEPIRDLVVDIKKPLNTLKRAKTYLSKPKEASLNEEDEKLIQKQSDCILCSSCYSSCPVFETNEEFLGPFALSRSYRYIADKREENKKEKIEAVVKDGIFDCTLCGNCTLVCPQGIDPKSDILMLQSKALQYGFQNPKLSNFGSFGLDF